MAYQSVPLDAVTQAVEGFAPAWVSEVKFAAVGVATEERQLKLIDPIEHTSPVDMPMDILLGKPPKMQRDVTHAANDFKPVDVTGLELEDVARRVLLNPTVADKSFLITIGDRSVGGMTVRDQMVGPWQVPVADVAVTTLSFEGYRGEAMAMCRELKQVLKVEHIETGLAEEQRLSFYRQGEFLDLYRGRHIPSAGAIGAFSRVAPST